MSAARCAIVSYNNHDTDELLSIDKAKRIYNHLISDTNPHWTPCEHQARNETNEELSIRLKGQEALSDMLKLNVNYSNEHEIREAIKKLNYYANLNKWVSHRYIKERYEYATVSTESKEKTS